ncbi:MAG: hypothetical protein AABY09_01380, partial [Nanoarchaeota archaeon]
RTFCRTEDGRMVKGVILVSSNADTDTSWDYEYSVNTKGECNPEWRGTVKVTWQFENTDAMGFATQAYTRDGSMFSNDVLVFDTENDEFLLKDQHITYSYNEQQVTTYPDECGPQRSTLTNVQSGTGHGSWEIDEHNTYDSDAPTRIRGEDGEYELDVDVGPSYDWLTSTDTRDKVYKPCGFEGRFTPTAQGSTNDVYNGASSMMKYMLSSIKLQTSEDRLRLYASETVNINWGTKQIPIHVEADYRFG